MNSHDPFRPDIDDITEAAKFICTFNGWQWDLLIPGEREQCYMEAIDKLKDMGASGPLIEDTAWVTQKA